MRDLIATRDNERNAQAFRLSPTSAKLLAFALAGFIASFAGGVLVLHQQALGEDIFAPIESIRVLTMVVVGGLGSIPGAILGAVFIKSTEWFNVVVPAAVPVPLHVRRERHRAHRRAVAPARRPRLGALPGARQVAAPRWRVDATSSCRR